MSGVVRLERIRAYAIRCGMCGREAGQLIEQVFYQDPSGPVPVVRRGGSCCGRCGGHLGCFADEPAQYAVDRLPQATERWTPGVRGRPPHRLPPTADPAVPGRSGPG